MKKLLLICSLLILSILCYSQEFRIQGTVVDVSNTPIEGAYIIFLKNDSVTHVNSAITTKGGKFNIVLPDRAKYILSINHLLYKECFLPVEVRDSVLTIQLEQKKFTLEEVTIVGTQPKGVTFKEGNLIFLPSAIGNTSVDNALTLLEKMPSIEITSSGDILLNGKIVSFEINGRKRNHSGASLLSVLRSLPADQIKEIVIKPTSSAEDRADLIGGVNIVTKKMNDSFLIAVAGRSSLKDRNIDGAGNLFFAIQKKNIYMDATLGGGDEYIKDRYKQNIFYYNNETGNGFSKSIGRNDDFLGSINCELSLKNYRIVSSFLAFADKGKRDLIAGYDYLDKENVLKERSLDIGKRNFDEVLYTASVGFKSNDSCSFSHSFNYEVIWGNSQNSTNILNTSLVGRNDKEANTVIDNFHNGAQHILNYDVSYRKGTSEVKLGARLDFGNLSPETVYDSIIGNKAVYIPMYSTRYGISENIYAVYFSWKKKLSKMTSFTFGTRGEYTNMQAKSILDNVNTEYNKFHLFPFIALSSKFKGVSSTVNLSSSIDRLPFSYYIPNYRYSSKYIYTIGNPNLHPERVYTLSWSNMLFNFISLNIQYSYAKDVYYSITRNIPETYFQETTYLNISDENRFKIQLNVPFEFFKKRLRGYFSLNGAYMKFVNLDESIQLNKNRKYINLSNLLQFEIVKGLNITTLLQYYSKTYYAQNIIDPYLRLKVILSYGIKNINFGLSVNDALNTASMRRMRTYQGKSYSDYEQNYMQYFQFAIQYNFSSNNLKKKNIKNIDISRFKY